MGPEYSLLIVAALLVMGAANWRKRRIRRAVRDLSTRNLRQLGPDPYFDPPEQIGPDLAAYAALHRWTLRVVHICWGLAALWLGFVFFLLVGGAGT